MTDCIISDKDKKYTKRMLDYNLFHKHPVNKLIHTIAIPQIIWTSCVLLSFIPLPIVTNMSYLVYGLMLAYYFDIKREYGVDMSIFMGSLLLFSKIFMLVFTNYLAITLFVFTMSWIAQFAGHYVWEKIVQPYLRVFLMLLLWPHYFVILKLKKTIIQLKI